MSGYYKLVIPALENPREATHCRRVLSISPKYQSLHLGAMSKRIPSRVFSVEVIAGGAGEPSGVVTMAAEMYSETEWSRSASDTGKSK